MNPGAADDLAKSATNRRFEADAIAKADVGKAFLEYYALAEQPFGVTPDPRFLYLGSKHREALSALDYGTKTSRGFLALIAKPGMGKTSLLFQYLESLRDTTRTALVFQTDGDSRDLMRYLLADLGLDGTGKDLPEMRSMLNEVLLGELRAGRRFVLVIDEAQNLDERGLESIRLLSNFETPWAKLMQIVLAGQPQLAERLASTSMTQLRQRISFFIKIEPFTSEETIAYIDHRLWVAGYKGPQLFTASAQRLITEHSEGVPRMINNLCFSAMSLGWALKRETIDHDMIRDVLADLDPCPSGPSNGKRPNIAKSEGSTGPSLNPVALNIRPKQGISPVLFPIQKDSPRRGWLPKLAAGAALVMVLGWSVGRLSAVRARASELRLQTRTAATIAADVHGAGPDVSASEPTAAAPSDDSTSGVFEPGAIPSAGPTQSAGDVLGSPIHQYWTQMSAEIRKLFRSLAQFTRSFRNAS